MKGCHCDMNPPPPPPRKVLPKHMLKNTKYPEIPQKTFKAETVYNYTGKFKKPIQHKESPFNLSYSGKDIDTNKKWYLGYKFLDIY